MIVKVYRLIISFLIIGFLSAEDSSAQIPLIDARCPSTIAVQKVTRFTAFSNDVKKLPAEQRAIIDTVITRILSSFLPGCTAITIVLVEGYSDIIRDHPEWTEAQRFSKEDEVSLERSISVRDYIKGTIEATNLGIASHITFMPSVGYGRLDASPLKIDENRRVTITTSARAIPQPKEKPNLAERGARALDLARKNGFAPMECALLLFNRRNEPGVSLFYVDAQKPITVVKGQLPISLLWQGTTCPNGGFPSLCHEENYGVLNMNELLAFTTDLLEDIKSTRFDPQRPDIDIVDKLKQIDQNVKKAHEVLSEHIRRMDVGADKGRLQLLALEVTGSRNPNDIHSCFLRGK